MPPPSLSGTPTTPGTPRKELSYGSVMKKQRVKMDVDSTAASTDAPEQSASQDQLEGVAADEEGVKEVTDGVREVELASQPQHAEAEKVVSETERTEVAVKEAEASTAETTTAAAVPLPESPILEARAPVEEPEVIEVDINGVEKPKKEEKVALAAESAEEVQEVQELEKASEVANAKDIVDLTQDSAPAVATSAQ